MIQDTGRYCNNTELEKDDDIELVKSNNIELGKKRYRVKKDNNTGLIKSNNIKQRKSDNTE